MRVRVVYSVRFRDSGSYFRFEGRGHIRIETIMGVAHLIRVLFVRMNMGYLQAL